MGLRSGLGVGAGAHPNPNLNPSPSPSPNLDPRNRRSSGGRCLVGCIPPLARRSGGGPQAPRGARTRSSSFVRCGAATVLTLTFLRSNPNHNVRKVQPEPKPYLYPYPTSIRPLTLTRCGAATVDPRRRRYTRGATTRARGARRAGTSGWLWGARCDRRHIALLYAHPNPNPDPTLSLARCDRRHT